LAAPVTAAALLAAALTPMMRAQRPVGPAPDPYPFVSAIFTDSMVLQRDKPDKIWGWSDPGDKIDVQMGDKSATAVAGADRRWTATLTPPPAGGPYTLKITGHKTVELHDVLVGDVWLCAGQSNMQFALRQAMSGDAEVKAANEPNIRFFTVGQQAAYKPTNVIRGVWKPVTPETADRVSAVAYYFARRVQKDVHVPIGLVVDAVGGTPAESWTSEAGLAPLPEFEPPMTQLKQLVAQGAPEYGNWVNHWYDINDLGQKQDWPNVTPDASWKTVTLPGGFAELGVPDSPVVVYFKKDIVLPTPLPAGRATISLGEIERMDTVWVNGRQVGGSSWVENPRNYFLPEGLLKPGSNSFTIRILKTKVNGGFLGKADELHLTLGDKSVVSLAGAWQGKVSVDARPPIQLPISYQNWPVIPTVLYQGMVAPLTPLSITGALWYQGEENSERGFEYRRVLPAMIADWRKNFGQGDFPFYIVSLPAYKARTQEPGDDEWAETREAQSLTAAKTRNSCLAITIDTGDPDNIHPKEKIPAGERLADCALANYYGKKIPFQGPSVAAVGRNPDSIRLRFEHTEGGLVAKGGKLEGFQIAGDDRKWVWADARIDGDAVVVSSGKVLHPTQVRYAWQSNPPAPLFNGAGLPAGPFRTDNWPGMTESHRPY
jgi:sialate O-acetylesterase